VGKDYLCSSMIKKIRLMGCEAYLNKLKN
jgi:hypothetical protein